MDQYMELPDSPRATARVVAEYQTNYPDPLTMAAGDLLAPGRRDSENEGWIWCTSAEGKSGWVPERFLELQGDQATALTDYTARELNLRTGEELVLYRLESGWFWATNADGDSGWVPADHIDVVPVEI